MPTTPAKKSTKGHSRFTHSNNKNKFGTGGGQGSSDSDMVDIYSPTANILQFSENPDTKEMVVNA